MRWFGWFGVWSMLFVGLVGLSACPPSPPVGEGEASGVEARQEATSESLPQEPVGTEVSQEISPEAVAENTTEPSAEAVADGGGEPVPEKAEPTPETTLEATQETSAESPLPDATGPISLAITHPDDVVASYLLSGTAWNYFSGKTVPLGRHFGTGNPSYFTAFRFRQVAVPQGATVVSAYLSFYPQNEVDSNNRLMINIYAEKAADSAVYDVQDYTKGRPDQRSKTTAKIDRWIVRCNADCTDDVTSAKYEYDCTQRKKDCWDRQTAYQVPKDLKTLLQEVFAQSSWRAGNAISLFLFNAATDQDGEKYKSSRTITGSDTALQGKEPRLVIQFQ